MSGVGQPLISVHPDELKFIFELEKPSYCDLKVGNNTEHHVAFKFNKGEWKTVEECKLRVVYASPNTSNGYDAPSNSGGNPDNAAVQHVKDERDAVVRQTQKLQQWLDILTKRKVQKVGSGFSFKFALFVALIGLMTRFFLKLSLTSPSIE